MEDVMKRVWGHVFSGVSLLGLGVAVISACKSDQSSLFIQDVLAQPLVTPGQACQFTADPTQPSISGGRLDIGFLSGYSATFLVGNQLVPEVNSQQLATETDIITIQGATVRITDAAGNQLAYFTQLAAQTVYPSSGGVPGYAPIQLTIVDQPTISTLTSNSADNAIITGGGTFRLVTYTKFFGYTTGGRSVTSDEFEFPVDVCYGCVVEYVNNPLYPKPNCGSPSEAAASSATTSTQPLACTPGEDDNVPCTSCLQLPVCVGGTDKAPLADAGIEAGTD
jgi:hypothetical protein